MVVIVGGVGTPACSCRGSDAMVNPLNMEPPTVVALSDSDKQIGTDEP